MHVDFAYKPGSQGDCPKPLCCREGQPGECRNDPTLVLNTVGFFYLAPGHVGAGFW